MADKPSFNVIFDPWIPVETTNGTIEMVGIRKILQNAHNYRKVSIASPLFSYGVQRVLIAFLIDAFHPKDVDELCELIGQGRFDSNRIDDYIEECRKDGECFDLFDLERPFMQTVFNCEEDKEDNIVRIFPEWPEGNNHVHFNHAKEDSHQFTPAECARALCALPAFAMNYGRSTMFGLNGIPPIYLLHAGKNLFETFALSMVTESEYSTIDFNDPPIAWRDTVPVEEGDAITRISLLHGLTSRPRNIQLIPETTDSGVVLRKMKYGKGRDYKTVSNWKDPHVAYYYDVKGVRKTLRAREGRAVWRDLGSILPKECRPVILNRVEDKLSMLSDPSEFAALQSYVLIGKFKGPVYATMSWYEEPIPNHLYLFTSEEKIKFLLDCLNLIESINSMIGKTLSQTIKQLRGIKDSNHAHSRYAQLSDQAQVLFLSSSKDYVLNELSVTIRDSETRVDWEIPIKAEVGKQLNVFALKSFDDIVAGLGTSAKAMEWTAFAKDTLIKRIAFCMKGGWRVDSEQRKAGTKN